MNKVWDTVSMLRGTVKSALARVGQGLSVTFYGRPGEQVDDKKYYQQYGLQSCPRDGSEVIALRQGNRIYIVAGDDVKYRVELDKGDVVLYSDTNNYIKMKKNGGIEVTANNEVVVNALSIKLGGALLTDLDGVVTKSCQCNFFGPAHPVGSTKVKASLA